MLLLTYAALYNVNGSRLFGFICFKSPFLLDWENEVLARRQKAGRGNLADDSATNAAIEAASIKKLTFKADSLQRVMQCTTVEQIMQNQ